MISLFPNSVTKINGTDAPLLRNKLLAAISDILLIPYIKPRGYCGGTVWDKDRV